MAISVENTPPKVELSGIPVLFELLSDNFIQTAGQVAILQVSFSATANEDEYFILSWGVIEITFTCKANPDTSGTQFQDGSVIANLVDWVALLATYLNLNYYLQKDFIITSGGSILIITSKLKLENKTLTYTNGGTTGTQILNQPGIDTELRPFFKIGLQTLIKEDSGYIPISEDLQSVDSTGTAIFNIQIPLNAQLTPEFNFPEASDEIIIYRPLVCREYIIKYYERFGSPPENQQITIYETIYFALLGGISYLQRAIYNRQDSNYWAKVTYNEYFLTWQPVRKIINKLQTEKLYFLIYDNWAEIRLKIHVHYNDETPDFLTTKDTVSNPEQYQVYEMCLSNNILQLPGWDEDIIEMIEIHISDQADERISEFRYYTYDYGYHENSREFFFLNSLGGWDTVRTTGQAINELEYERTNINKVLNYDFTEKDRQISQLKPSETKIFKVNTGWKSEDDVDWLRDLLLSTETYQIIYGKLVPINIISKKIFQKRDNSKLFFLEFEYQRAFTNEFYTKELLASEFNDDFNDDFANQ